MTVGKRAKSSKWKKDTEVQELHKEVGSKETSQVTKIMFILKYTNNFNRDVLKNCVEDLGDKLANLDVFAVLIDKIDCTLDFDHLPIGVMDLWDLSIATLPLAVLPYNPCGKSELG